MESVAAHEITRSPRGARRRTGGAARGWSTRRRTRRRTPARTVEHLRPVVADASRRRRRARDEGNPMNQLELYRMGKQSAVDLLSTLDDEALDTTCVACPAWSIRDV